jgi:hypothetical protein
MSNRRKQEDGEDARVDDSRVDPVRADEVIQNRNILSAFPRLCRVRTVDQPAADPAQRVVRLGRRTAISVHAQLCAVLAGFRELLDEGENPSRRDAPRMDTLSDCLP